MYPIELLPKNLRAKSYNSRDIVLDFTHALLAIDILAAASWAVCGWEGRVLVSNELRTLHHIRYETKNNDLLWRFQVRWRIDESWDDYVDRAAEKGKATIQQTQELLNQLTDRAIYFKFEALAPHPYLEKINGILAQNFAGKGYLMVEATTGTVPLVAATLRKDLYGGLNRSAKVVGRFRRKNRWIKGVCPIASLDNFRPKLVYIPNIIKKLEGEAINRFIFPRFFAMPTDSDQAE
jgi:hypothetical protein